jgi:hypothetical protein
MRHPAAPTIIAVLLGFLAFMILWARVRGDGHHEGNPHPSDLPKKQPEMDAGDAEGEGEGGADADADVDASAAGGRKEEELDR